MARNAKVSRLFKTGNLAALMRRSVARCSRSSSSSSQSGTGSVDSLAPPEHSGAPLCRTRARRSAASTSNRVECAITRLLPPTAPGNRPRRSSSRAGPADADTAPGRGGAAGVEAAQDQMLDGVIAPKRRASWIAPLTWASRKSSRSRNTCTYSRVPAWPSRASNSRRSRPKLGQRPPGPAVPLDRAPRSGSVAARKSTPPAHSCERAISSLPHRSRPRPQSLSPPPHQAVGTE